MSSPTRGEILRAPLFDTPRNPFLESNALRYSADGALWIAEGRIGAVGDYAEVRKEHPEAPVRDLREGYLIPGLIDTHIHFPQLRVMGGLGLELLGWLEKFALPEEARMADAKYACDTARKFVRALLSHGTTTALVFGAHFGEATASLFEAANAAGLRVVSGLVLSDRMLREELHQRPEAAYRDSKELIARFHGKGTALYAVTPRFAFSTSEAMLEVCQSLLREEASLRFTTHMNENRAEMDGVARLFPWASDYLGVYERYGLARRGSVMAHNLHGSDDELRRMASSGSAVAHCPCSNAALGSGFFPFRRHVEAGVCCALGTDVGGGTGFGILKEGLQAYMLQRLAPGGLALEPAHLLYLATRAGAEALDLENETGDFAEGKSADVVWVRAREGSPLKHVLERAESPERVLAALFTLGDGSAIGQVRVAGKTVYEA